MKIISVLDTTVCNYNMGNAIIMEAIYRVIDELFPDAFIVKLQYAEKFGKQSLRYIRTSDYTFMGGTNILSSKMNKYSQIGFKLWDTVLIKNKLILLGVGWWQYQEPPNLYTRFLLRNLLSKDIVHSVRDSYTKRMLEKIGIANVINTSCPTTWYLTEDHCRDIPITKRDNVLITLTDYSKNKDLDQKFIDIIFMNYKKIFFWVQGIGDLEYLSSLNILDKNRLYIIPPKLHLYDNILENEDVDYIGTRLHAGIRAIQHKKRALIIAVDNRAKEIANDIGLNIVERGDTNGILNFINNDYVTRLNIPFDNIRKWKEQFK